jgi:hypothetical protein
VFFAVFTVFIESGGKKEEEKNIPGSCGGTDTTWKLKIYAIYSLNLNPDGRKEHKNLGYVGFKSLQHEH